MALQNAEKSYFHSEQNGLCIQQIIEVHDIVAHDFANKVPALLARKSREPLLLCRRSVVTQCNAPILPSIRLILAVEEALADY